MNVLLMQPVDAVCRELVADGEIGFGHFGRFHCWPVVKCKSEASKLVDVGSSRGSHFGFTLS